MRVAHLATSDLQGRPHVIPIVFAVEGPRLYTPLDEKPKRVGPKELRRVQNLALNPQVAIVVDAYDDDWVRLAWVLIRGNAEILEAGETHDRGVDLLHSKYPQYREMPLDRRPVIAVTPESVSSWGML
jgi:PPOX class probable F420-dependent enzyme